jgi:subtilisin
MGQILPAGIDRIDADRTSTRSGDGRGSVNINVAVLDTGIDIEHPDLNVVGGKDCTSGSGFDDPNAHGTHVAGTIAARDDDIGVVGVVPGARHNLDPHHRTLKPATLLGRLTCLAVC